jgi:hypothetical protein
MLRVICVAALLSSTPALADDAAKKPAGDSFRAADSTNIDFSDTLIDGKMQAPAGFFLQGRQAQSMSQMVKLRSKWRSELRNSKAAVKALAK